MKNLLRSLLIGFLQFDLNLIIIYGNLENKQTLLTNVFSLFIANFFCLIAWIMIFDKSLNKLIEWLKRNW